MGKLSMVNTAYAQNLRQTATDAWEEGSRYFAPHFGSISKVNNAAAMLDWPHMIDAIESVGWQLHTWCANSVDGKPFALPLFVRPL